MPKKKALLKKVKQQLQDRRDEAIRKLDALYKKRSASEDRSELDQEIDQLIAEIGLIDDDLARKDKKSSRITWLDGDYSPAPKPKGSNAKIVDLEEYESAKESVATWAKESDTDPMAVRRRCAMELGGPGARVLAFAE